MAATESAVGPGRGALRRPHLARSLARSPGGDLALRRGRGSEICFHLKLNLFLTIGQMTCSQCVRRTHDRGGSGKRLRHVGLAPPASDHEPQAPSAAPDAAACGDAFWKGKRTEHTYSGSGSFPTFQPQHQHLHCPHAERNRSPSDPFRQGPGEALKPQARTHRTHGEAPPCGPEKTPQALPQSACRPAPGPREPRCRVSVSLCARARSSSDSARSRTARVTRGGGWTAARQACAL